MIITELVLQTRKLVFVVCIFSGMLNANALDLGKSIDEIRILSSTGNNNNALKETEGLIDIAPDNPQLLFLKATILERMGKTDDAIKIYEGLTINHPELPEPFNNLAIYYASIGNYDAAIKALEAALKGHESYAAVFVNLHAIYDKLASDAYRKALNSTSPENPLNLAMLDQVILPRISTDSVLIAQNDEQSIVLSSATESDSNIAQNNTALEETEISVTSPDNNTINQTENPPASETDSQITETILISDSKTDISTVEAEVKQHVENWAKSWANRDYEHYLTHYSSHFIPRDNLSLKEWKEQRRGRLLWRDFIIVELSDMEIEVEGEDATAKFTQYYKSNIYEDTGRKTLKLIRKNGDWFITRELI